MLLNTITERHPNSFVLLKPKSRDGPMSRFSTS